MSADGYSGAAHIPQWDAGSTTGAIDSALHVDYIHLTTYVIGDVGYYGWKRVDGLTELTTREL